MTMARLLTSWLCILFFVGLVASAEEHQVCDESDKTTCEPVQSWQKVIEDDAADAGLKLLQMRGYQEAQAEQKAEKVHLSDTKEKLEVGEEEGQVAQREEEASIETLLVASDDQQPAGVKLVSKSRYWGCARKGVDGGHGCKTGSLEQCAAKVKENSACVTGQFDYNGGWCGGQCKCVTQKTSCTSQRGHGGYTTYSLEETAKVTPAKDGVFESQRFETKSSDIRGNFPRVKDMRECRCKASAVKNEIAGVNYNEQSQLCIMLKKGSNTNKRIPANGWSASTDLQCIKKLKEYDVPASCNGKRGWEHAKCTRLRGAAASTKGTWMANKKCGTYVSTNPKLYDWSKAKDYCLKGNSYCVGIQKRAVRKGGRYVNQYTFCKEWRGKLHTSYEMYSGVLEVTRAAKVWLDEEEFAKYG